jgi:hypothetical protein
MVKKSSKKSQDVDMEFIGSKDENAEMRTLSSRDRIREQLDADIEAFINQGGAIEQVEAHVTGDPPQKPVSNYGSRPI